MKITGFRTYGAALLGGVAVSMLSGCPAPKPVLHDAHVPPKYSTLRPEALPHRLAIPIRSLGNHLLIPAAVNGIDGGDFLLDTGAAIDAIGLGFAGRLQLPMAGKGQALGIGGIQHYRYRPIESLTIANLELPYKQLAGINLSGFARSVGTPVNGVIGYRSLRFAPFTIDYRHDTLTLYRPSTFTAPEGTTATPYRDIGGVPRVLADLGKGRKVWLIVDTGADAELALPYSVAERWPDIVGVPVSGLGQSTGVGGGAGHTSTWLKSLRVFGVELQLVPVNFERTPRGAAEAGRIGHQLLKNFELTFDPRTNVIYTTFQPN